MAYLSMANEVDAIKYIKTQTLSIM